ncbi:hypothetical protein ACH4FE_35790 [Streptomyces celluloflavus]|uniref:hypothetical protein n=1 Tax=Streptomyces celluloflavus TaxID=58344 RepID=UPI0037BB1C84
MEDLMPTSMTSVIARPYAGLDDEIRRIEREDDAEGPTGNRRLGAYLLRLVDDGDRRAAAVGRRAPRTLAEMRQRLAAVAATEEDLNRELDNPSEDWDQALRRTVLPQANGDTGGGICGGCGAYVDTLNGRYTCTLCDFSS